LPFIANNGQNPRMGFELRKKGKVVKVEELVKRVKKIQEETQAVLKKVQEEIKNRQIGIGESQRNTKLGT